MTKPLRGGVRLRGVSKTYGEAAAAVHALREVDLDILAGELVAILGRADRERPRCSTSSVASNRPIAGR